MRLSGVWKVVARTDANLVIVQLQNAGAGGQYPWCQEGFLVKKIADAMQEEDGGGERRDIQLGTGAGHNVYKPLQAQLTTRGRRIPHNRAAGL